MNLSPNFRNLFFNGIYFMSQVLYAQPDPVQCFGVSNINIAFESNFKKLGEVNKPIVLLGESHGVAENYGIFLNLIKALNANGTFRYLAFERSYAETLLFNKFLETGDDAYLKWDVSFSIEMKEFFNQLYTYNNSLPDEQKISFIGVDAIHSIHAFVAGIRSLIPKEPAPQQIAGFIDSLRSFRKLKMRPKSNNDYFGILDSALEKLRNEVESNRQLYMKYFGNNFVRLDFIVKSKSSYSKPRARNKEMFNNLNSILKKLNYELNVLGFFGSNHMLTYKSMNNSFATLLDQNENSIFSGRVIKILIDYENSMSYFRSEVVKVPRLTEYILNRKERGQLSLMVNQRSCQENIIMQVPGELTTLKSNCRYLIHLRNGRSVTPINQD